MTFSQGTSKAKPSATKAKAAPVTHPSIELSPQVIALVARSQRGVTKDEYVRGFQNHWPEIVKVASKHHADVLLPAMESHYLNESAELPTRAVFVGARSTLQAAFIGAYGRPEPKERVHAYIRDVSAVPDFQQAFGSSSDKRGKKQQFMNELHARRFGDVLYLACGESNIVKVNRDDRSLRDDDFGFLESDAYRTSKIILNPGHSLMVPFWSHEKRRLLSADGRWCISVWNDGLKSAESGGNVRERKYPWEAFFDGHEEDTKDIEVEHDIPNFRIGILDLRAATKARGR